ncbi:MAG: cache domain-containing protein [Candidatus Riflebacteria bacterium]|nr:cache domain-containing protein [Candidatus Riflebacteria bacterium]
MKEDQNKYIFPLPKYQIKEYRFYPKTEGIIAGLGMLAILSFSVWFMYYRGYEAILIEIQEGLTRLASAAALMVDGETHRSLRSIEQKNDPKFISMSKNLDSMRRAMKDIKYIYTNTIEPDGKVYFVLDPSPQDDLDGDGKPDEAPVLMSEEYTDVPDTMKKALTEKVTVVESEPISDKWGTFLSAYAPIFDKQGKFSGTLGLDLELSGFKERFKNVVASTKRLAIICVVFAVLFGVSLWFNRRFAWFLNESRIKMLADFKRSVDYATKTQIRENMILLKLSDINSMVIGKAKDGSLQMFDRLNEMNQELKNLARIDFDYPENTRENFSFKKFIEKEAETTFQKFRHKNIEHEIIYTAGIPELVSGNPESVKLMFSVLFQRACEECNGNKVIISLFVSEETLNDIRLAVELKFSGKEPVPRTLHELLENWNQEDFKKVREPALPNIREAQALKLFLKNGAKWKVDFSGENCTAEVSIGFLKFKESLATESTI